MDPQTEESHAAVLLAFVNQAAPDIRRKLQKIEGLGEQTIQDLLKAAEKGFNNRETPKETEERELILAEARKWVPGADGRPTTQPHLVDEGFPLFQPNWDFERAEGRERLLVYRQTLMAGLRAAMRKPTNLAKVNLVRQEPTESPAAFLERLMEAFRQYGPPD